MPHVALITGATGYVGSKLAQRLVDEGWHIHALVRDSGRPLNSNLASRASVHVYDGSTESVDAAVNAASPDVVFHLASLFIAEHRSQSVLDLINSNVLLGTQLIEACVRRGIASFLNTGTSWQHYRTNEYDPVCLYAATKQAFEDILDFYTDAFLIRAVTLKLFDTYGPGDPRPKLIPLLRKALETGESLDLSPGHQSLDLVHIDDVTEAFLLAGIRLINTTGRERHERFAVSSGVTISIRELASLMQEIANRAITINYGAREYRTREVMKPWRGGHPIPGWVPRVAIRSGLASVFCDGR